MRTTTLLAVALLGVACGGNPEPKAAASPDMAEVRKELEQLLDNWHTAAARADESAYFSYFAPQAVYIGTDPKERWDLEAFRLWAHPKFAKGKAWEFKSKRRVITVGPSGDVAWFDEDIVSKNMGALRASGVISRGGTEGKWRIVHYDLSIPVPNDKADAVRKVIEGE